MELQLNPGDKVRLISGGPVMTVRGKHYDVLVNEYNPNMIDCIWFAKNNEGREQAHYCPFQKEELIMAKHG